MRASRLPIRSGTALQSADYLTTRELASLLHVTPWALLRWRRDGDGPSFLRIGRNSIRYPRCAVERYIRQRLRSKIPLRKGQQ